MTTEPTHGSALVEDLWTILFSVMGPEWPLAACRHDKDVTFLDFRKGLSEGDSGIGVQFDFATERVSLYTTIIVRYRINDHTAEMVKFVDKVGEFSLEHLDKALLAVARMAGTRDGA